MPCESCPHRLASTRLCATRAASSAGTPQARKRESAKAVSFSALKVGTGMGPRYSGQASGVSSQGSVERNLGRWMLSVLMYSVLCTQYGAVAVLLNLTHDHFMTGAPRGEEQNRGVSD